MASASNTHRVKCGLLNVQSTRNKTLAIRDLINEECLDMFAITETWLSDHDFAVIKEMTPVTHTFLHNPRGAKRGGGVGIFLTSTIKKIRKLTTNNYTNFEVLQIECEITGNKVLIIVVYRPPSTSVSAFIDEFSLFLDNIDMVSAMVTICGDFNLWLDDLDARYVSHFIDTMATYNLINAVEKPTSIGGHIIDLVFSDRTRDLVQNVYVDEVCTLSPVHKLVTFMMSLRIVERCKMSIRFRSTRNFDPETLVTAISTGVNTRFNEVCIHQFTIENCHECLYRLYNETVRGVYEKMCPTITKEIIVKDESPWFNEEISRAKKAKKKKEKLWRRHQSDESRREYNQARNFEKKLIVHRKRDFYKDRIIQAGSNINKLYKVLDNLTGKKKKDSLPEGYTDSELASEFLNYFDTKISRIVLSFDNTGTSLMANEHAPELKLSSFSTVDSLMIRNIIKQVKLTYCANDPLPMNLITSSGNFDQIVDIITKMVNTSISNGGFPASEKKAIVKPVIKGKLDPHILSSFRPVSNLTVQSKILENVLLSQLNMHLNTVGVLPDEQSAYRRLYSTETALCSVVSEMRGLLDDGKCGILLLLDLSAAFDTVVHDILLRVCENFGIEGSALSYLRSYLEGRTYCVQIGECFSVMKTLTRGVPQGSVLGPILFCLYTADLSTVLERHGVSFKLFADDTQFYLSVNNIQETETQLSAIMSDIKQWMEDRQLKLNDKKTECLFVGRRLDFDRLQLRDLHVNDFVLEVSNIVKDLGVMLDSELTLKNQITQTVNLAGYHLRNIAFVRKYLDDSTMKRLIHNHVISKIDYCNSLYYGLPNYLLRKLQLIMNRAARLIKGQSSRERITPVLVELHWLPVKARIIYKQCIMVYRVLKFGKPEYMKSMLTDFRVDTNVTLRHGAELQRLHEPRFFREAGRRAFNTSAPRLYNRLPASVKTAETLPSFKRRLKTHLFADCYDLVNNVIKEDYRC